MNEIQKIKEYADILRLTYLRNNAESIVHRAQIDNPTYLELILDVVRQEVLQRKKSDLDRRRRMARLLKNSDLDGYDFNYACGIDRNQLRQLRELVWVEAIDDEVLVTALLDRLLYHCQVLKFPDCVEVLCRVPDPLQAGVLPEDDVKLPVHAFDGPVFSDGVSYLFSLQPFVGGDEIAGVGSLLACLLVYLPGIDPHQLLQARPLFLLADQRQVAR